MAAAGTRAELLAPADIASATADEIRALKVLATIVDGRVADWANTESCGAG